MELPSADQQRAQACQVHAAAADDHAHTLAAQLDAHRACRCKAQAPLGSTTGCMRSAKNGHAVHQLLVRHREDVVRIAPDDGKTDLPQVLRLRAIGNRLGRIDVRDGPGAPGMLAVVARSGHYAEELAAGRQGPRGQRRARQEPAAAQAHEQRVECADYLEQLLRRRAVPWSAGTSAWSNGGITLRPYCGAIARVLCSRSSM